MAHRRQSRETLDLRGAWTFQVDPFNAGERAGYFAAEMDDSGWRRVTLPAGFDGCGPGLTTYQGYGWFRRAFTVPAAWRGRAVRVHCGAVNYRATVWLNGCCLGEHSDPFLPFAFAVEALLRYGEENVLTVRVDAAPRAGEVPGVEHGWRPIGGILREVTLRAMPPLRLENLRWTAGADGTYRLRVMIENDLDAAERTEARLTLYDANGIVHRQGETYQVPAGGDIGVGFDGTVAGARLWSPDDPALYTTRVELWADGELTDSLEARVGFRTVAVEDGRLLLNGRPIVLRGFNRHEDSPHTGMAMDLETARRDFLAMRETGANFVRLAHYPHHPGELDLCDELGLLAMCEIPVYWWTGLDEGEARYAGKLDAARRQLSALIARDGSHPSVIIWSVSNETREARPGVREGNDALIAHAKALDPSRLVVHIADESVWTTAPHFPLDDLLCVNGYPTWFKGMEAGNPDYDVAESTRFWRGQLATLHAAYPDKPIFITEFGYPCLEGFSDGPLGEATQAGALAAEFAGMAAPYVCGILIWCFADHPWPEINAIRNLTTSPFGVVTRDRQPKHAYDVARALFRQP